MASVFKVQSHIHPCIEAYALKKMWALKTVYINKALSNISEL